MKGKKLLAELRRVLNYDLETGEFTWLITRNSRGGGIRPGSRAGTSKDGYVQIGYTDSEGVKHLFRAHRLAWWFVEGKMPKEIDHDDTDRAANAWWNLREATRTQNNLNRSKLQWNNVSGKTGVSWRANRGTWLARLVVDGQIVLNQYFRDKKDAIAARKAAELEHVGRSSPS